ncbi:FeoB-associated Cys-rich membrane protein [Runella zeae]|nr:FeoB-associated Cys-rich membrane protein [Runella zeae]
MLETIIISALFLGALGYVGNRLRKELSPKKSGCGKACGCTK